MGGIYSYFAADNSLSVPIIPFEHIITIPSIYKFGSKFENGIQLKVKGVLLKNQKRFHINLRSKALVGYQDTIPLHISVRPQEQQLSCSYCKDGEFFHEKVARDFPFRYKKPFEIVITCFMSKFEIIVDGNVIMDFTHRTTASYIKFVSFETEGASIHSVVVCNQVETDGDDIDLR